MTSEAERCVVEQHQHLHPIYKIFVRSLMRRTTWPKQWHFKVHHLPGQRAFGCANKTVRPHFTATSGFKKKPPLAPFVIYTSRITSSAAMKRSHALRAGPTSREEYPTLKARCDLYAVYRHCTTDT